MGEEDAAVVQIGIGMVWWIVVLSFEGLEIETGFGAVVHIAGSRATESCGFITVTAADRRRGVRRGGRVFVWDWLIVDCVSTRRWDCLANMRECQLVLMKTNNMVLW